MLGLGNLSCLMALYSNKGKCFLTHTIDVYD